MRDKLLNPVLLIFVLLGCWACHDGQRSENKESVAVADSLVMDSAGIVDAGPGPRFFPLDTAGLVSWLDSFLLRSYPGEYTGESPLDDRKMAFAFYPPQDSASALLLGSIRHPYYPMQVEIYRANFDGDPEPEYLLLLEMGLMNWSNALLFFDDAGHDFREAGQVEVPTKEYIDRVEFRHLRSPEVYEVLVYRIQPLTVYLCNDLVVVGWHEGEPRELGRTDLYFFDNVGTNELTDYDQGQFWQEKTALDFVEREGIEEVHLLMREELVRDAEDLIPSQYPLIKLLKEKRDTLDLLSID